MILFTVVSYIIVFGIQGMHPKADEERFSLAEGGLQFPVCGNCSKVRNVRSGLGFACHSADEFAVASVEQVEVFKNSHMECIPKTYKLVRYITNFCCFWSPETGCAVIIGRRYYGKDDLYCQICKDYCLGTKQLGADNDRSYKISAFGYLIAMALVVLWMCPRELK